MPAKRWLEPADDARTEVANYSSEITALKETKARLLSSIAERDYPAGTAGELLRDEDRAEVAALDAGIEEVEHRRALSLDRLRAETAERERDELRRRYNLSELRTWLSFALSVVALLLSAYGAFFKK